MEERRSSRSRFVLYTVILAVGWTASLAATVWIVQSDAWDLGYVEGAAAGKKKCLNYLAPEPNHISRVPVFIFDRFDVPWNLLAQNLDEPGLKGKSIDREVLGSFSVPGMATTTDISRLSWTHESVVFPGPGDYYLRTSLGSFKILILAPSADSMDRILATARFVTRNHVPGMYDERAFLPNPETYRYVRPDRLMRKLFVSDQPLLIHCYHATVILNYLLSLQGIEAQQVQLLSERGVGHVVSQVEAPDLGKPILVDVHWGFIPQDETGLYLSPREVFELVRSGRGDRLDAYSLGHHPVFREEYGLGSRYVGPITWTPEKTTDRTFVSADEYPARLAKHFHRYFLSEENRSVP